LYPLVSDGVLFCKQLEQTYAKVIDEDASAYDYDGVYDAMKAQQEETPLTGGAVDHAAPVRVFAVGIHIH
jgi:hypothetical protein